MGWCHTLAFDSLDLVKLILIMHTSSIGCGVGVVHTTAVRRSTENKRLKTREHSRFYYRNRVRQLNGARDQRWVLTDHSIPVIIQSINPSINQVELHVHMSLLIGD